MRWIGKFILVTFLLVTVTAQAQYVHIIHPNWDEIKPYDPNEKLVPLNVVEEPVYQLAQLKSPSYLFMPLSIAAGGCTIFDDFSGTLANWSTASMRGTWTNTETAGVMTVMTGDGAPTYASGDGDAGIMYSVCSNLYVHQWVEVKLVTFFDSVSGAMGGPLLRGSQSTIGSPGSGIWAQWIAWNAPDGQFYPQKITNDVWCCTLNDQNNNLGFASTFPTNHYLGIECIGNVTNLIYRIYDNGTSHADWASGWTSLIGEIWGVQGNFTIPQTEGKYTGLWYGTDTRTYPSSRFDDFRSGSFDSFEIDTFKRVTNNSTVTITMTLNAATTLVGLHVSCGNGATTRTGGTPDCNSNNLTQRGSTQKAAATPEGSSEYWDLISPPTGSVTITIPNTGAAPLYCTAVAFKTPAGKLPVFDVALGGNGTSANPSVTVTPTSGHVGDLIIAGAFTGNNNVPTLPQGINITRNDDGNFGDSMMYNIIGQPRNVTNKWTSTSDDWAITGGVYYLQ